MLFKCQASIINTTPRLDNAKHKVKMKLDPEIRILQISSKLFEIF